MQDCAECCGEGAAAESRAQPCHHRGEECLVQGSRGRHSLTPVNQSGQQHCSILSPVHYAMLSWGRKLARSTLPFSRH